MKMNKIFKKVAVLSVGLTMAIGAVVALNAGSKAERADAASYLAYGLDGNTADTSEGSTSGYEVESLITQSDVQWGVYGNTTMGPWRIGGLKKAKAADPAKTGTRTIASKAAVSEENITYVNFTAGDAASLTINSMTLKVGTGEGLSDVSEINDVAFVANSTMTFNRPDGKDWSNRFFTLEFSVTNNTTSNRFIQFKNLDFYYEVSVINPDTITVSGESTVAVGDSITLSSLATEGGKSEGVNQNVVWSSLDESKAVVSDSGVVTGISNGNVTIRATAQDVSSIYGDKTITVTGAKESDDALIIVPDDLPTSYGDNYVALHGVYTHVKQTMKNDGVIQIQKTNGLVENIAALPAAIKTIELTFNAAKTQGSGFTLSVSADRAEWTELEASQLYANRSEYVVSGSDNVFMKLVGPTTGTLYLDEILVGLGNALETKTVALAAALNDLLDSECTGDSDSTAITASKWADIESAYDEGDEAAKPALAAISSLSYIEINQFLERYDHIVSGYHYNDFLNRMPAESTNTNIADNNSLVLVIAIISGVSLVALSSLLILKKKIK